MSYRRIDIRDGNPSFATVVKVLSALDVKLALRPA